MTPIVLDASAGVELLLHSAAGRRVGTAIDGSTIWVPEHFYVEVEAAIRRLELRGVVTPAQAMATVDRLLALPTRRASVRTLAAEAWALRHNVTIGDALYVVMARHLHAALITLDVRLANAPTLGVTTRVP